MIQAPDERCRTEWSTPIEECIRRLDPTKVRESNLTLSRVELYYILLHNEASLRLGSEYVALPCCTTKIVYPRDVAMQDGTTGQCD